MREEVLNTLLAGVLARGLATALHIPEDSVRVVKSGGHRFPDVQVLDLGGVRIIVQGKIDGIDAAIEDCKQSIAEGLADVCIAASYPPGLAETQDIRSTASALESSDVELAIVKPPDQLTLEGWPEEAIHKLGKVSVSGIPSLLAGESIYDEVVGTDTAERIAANIGTILDGASRLPPPVQDTIARKLASLLSIEYDSKEEDGEEE